MYWAKVSQNTEVLRSGWDVLVISGYTFFGNAFFDVPSYCVYRLLEEKSKKNHKAFFAKSNIPNTVCYIAN